MICNRAQNLVSVPPGDTVSKAMIEIAAPNLYLNAFHVVYLYICI